MVRLNKEIKIHINKQNRDRFRVIREIDKQNILG